MNDLFSGFRDSAPASVPLSVPGRARKGARPGRSEQGPLSVPFTALANRFDKIERHEDMRDAYDSPDRTVNLLRVLADVFPDAWERVRAAELIDRCPAEHMVELVGSRVLAEKIADALKFPVEKLN